MPNDLMFSIIIPSYNRANLIGATLESLLNQTYGNFEIIVVDDGSKDNTEQVMQQWCRKDNRVRYFKKENGERGAARNFGIERASGEYVTFIDSDDLAYGHALQTVYHTLQQYNWPTCLASAYELKDINSGNTLNQWILPYNTSVNQALLKGNFLSCIGVFIRRKILSDLKFEEDRNFAGTEDWLLWLQLAARYHFVYCREILFCMCQHDSRSVMDFPESKLVYRTEHLKKRLEADSAFMSKYGYTCINQVYAHMLTYTSLHLAISKQKGRAISFLSKGLQVNKKELWSKRTFAILKLLVIG